jgi:N-methylhydantoinase A
MDHRRCYFGPRLGLRRTALLSRSTLGHRGKPGPFIIEEYDSTIVVPPGWRARLDAHGNVVIESRDAAG